MNKQVEIIKGKAFEIDPSKKYLIVFDRSEITLDDVSAINEKLREFGSDGVSVLVGHPENIKVVEL